MTSPGTCATLDARSITDPGQAKAIPTAPTSRPLSVLFACRDQASRSPMAGALLASLGGNGFHPHSAGYAPQSLHPHTREVMAEIGLDLSNHATVSLRTLLGRHTYHVAICLTACDELDAPHLFPGAVQQVRWTVPDPARDGHIDAYRVVRNQLQDLISLWLEKHPEQVLAGQTLANR